MLEKLKLASGVKIKLVLTAIGYSFYKLYKQQCVGFS